MIVKVHMYIIHIHSTILLPWLPYMRQKSEKLYRRKHIIRIAANRSVVKESHYKAGCKLLNRAVSQPTTLMKESLYKSGCKLLSRAVSQPLKLTKQTQGWLPTAQLRSEPTKENHESSTALSYMRGAAVP